MKRIICLLFVCAVIALAASACGSTPTTPAAPPQSTIDIAAVQTKAAQDVIAQMTASAPTVTPTSAVTPTPNPPTKTLTPTRTSTATKAPTPTNTETPTPLPPAIQTAQAIALQRTAIAMGATATREARNAQRTATAEAVAATATEIARYSNIKWQELVNYADSHKGELIKVRGTVFNIVGNQELQMWIAGTSEAVYVEMSEPFSGIYEDDTLMIYGEIGGENCFKNAYDAEICQPLIIDAFYTK